MVLCPVTQRTWTNFIRLWIFSEALLEGPLDSGHSEYSYSWFLPDLHNRGHRDGGHGLKLRLVLGQLLSGQGQVILQLSPSSTDTQKTGLKLSTMDKQYYFFFILIKFVTSDRFIIEIMIGEWKLTSQ